MKLWIKITLILVLLSPALSHAQVKPRVAGLGGNVEYMFLLEQEQSLSHKEDSLTNVIARIRKEFIENTVGRDKFAKDILRLEGEIFDVKNQAGIMAGKISEIEELFILSTLQSASEGGNDTMKTNGGENPIPEKNPALVKNAIFKERLSENDYAALVQAQLIERPVADLLILYFENYDAIAGLGAEYEQAQQSAVADSIFARYLVLDDLNTVIADSLSKQWSYIFDNKTFAYNYLLETENQIKLLTRFETAARDARDEIAQKRSETASEKILTYLIQKRLIFDYETTIAELFSLNNALDSLNSAKKIFELLARPIPDITYEERLFLDYEDTSIHSPSKYNSGNPIPETTIYPRGIIYRIMLAIYPQRQAVSAFKGVYPLGYLRRDDGKWAYYAGGYASLDPALTTLENMKKRGFRNAQIVVWNNGEALVLSDKEITDSNGTVIYRVEISGARGNLSENIRNAINAVDDGRDITRSQDNFIIGPFSTSLEAEKVASRVRETDNTLVVRIITRNF